MSASSLGSSPARARQFSHFSIHEEPEEASEKPALSLKPSKNSLMPGKEAMPLTTSKFANIKAPPNTRTSSGAKTRLSSSDAAMDKFLDGLSKHNIHVQDKDGNDTTVGSDESFQEPTDLSTDSLMLTPASNGSNGESSKDGQEEITVKINNTEVHRLQKELIDAKEQLARQRQALDHNRLSQDPVHDSLNSTLESEHQQRGAQVGNYGESAARGVLPTGSAYSQVPYSPMSVSQSTASDATPGGYGNPGLTAWPPSNRIGAQGAATTSIPRTYQAAPSWNASNAGPWNGRTVGPVIPSLVMPNQQRTLSMPMSPGPVGEGRFIPNNSNHFPGDSGLRRGNSQAARAASYYPSARPEQWDPYPASSGPLDTMGMPMDPNGMYQSLVVGQNPEPYQPRPIGTPLSPGGQDYRGGGNPWNSTSGAVARGPYVGPNTPTNYRRLLDRDMSCNWKYIVDKITCNNDQQASIFLQQKLKVGTAEQKFDIIEAIVAQAYPLMVNRFGNFLVQRCFEHGTPEQVLAIGNAIRGNTLSLSMDPFGCHVVQKAFDVVPDDYKAIMAHELFRRIPETVIHRYACHVWQKLFELTWNDDPPQIMKYVNNALKGMWPDVALGETGSLVVQNIFENQPEEDKRQCINEILDHIDLVAFGQFGNWCIQHICEHGAPQDRHRAIEHILHHAVRYSVDAYASKVVEKCLKINVPDFLGRYLERLCEGRPDRPRIPLVDISADQYGNYLIQWILTHAGPNNRDVVVSHVRKHTVSLRGSKYGSKVAQLCCNPAYTTHPGPGVGIGLSSNRYMGFSNSSRYTGAFR